MTSQQGKTPRDQTNKYMWAQLRTGNYPKGIPARVCKRGRAYMLDQPGAESERDDSFAGAGAATGTATDAPDF